MSLIRTLAAVVVDQSQLGLPSTPLTEPKIKIVLQIVFGIAGGTALLIVVVAGLRFVLSQGDPGAVTKNRNAVIYALVGLIVSALAYSIVTFVLDRV